MQNRTGYTSAAYFESRGLSVPKPLRDWLSKATFIAKDRPTTEDRQRYEWWVVNQVESASASPGGVEGKDWKGTSAVMPGGVEVRPPGTTPFGPSRGVVAAPQPTATPYTTSSPIGQTSARDVLLQECQLKSPPDLYVFVMKAMELLDDEVRKGRRTFQGVTFQQVSTVATKLKSMDEAKRRQQAAPPPPGAVLNGSASHTIVVPPPKPISYLPPTPPLSSHGTTGIYSASPYQVTAPASPYIYQRPGVPQQQSSVLPMYASPYVRTPLQASPSPAGGFMYGTATASHYQAPRPPISMPPPGMRRPRSPSPSSSECSDSSENESDHGRKMERQERFKVSKKEMKKNRKKTRLEVPAGSMPAGSSNVDPVSFFTSLTIHSESVSNKVWLIGVSSALERNYSRDEPCAEDIRPLRVLTKAFEFVVRKATSEVSPAGSKYLSDQLKGMRQDLVVQNIRSNFTVSVYEAHARAALDIANISEFTQCQAGLRGLYKEGLQAEDGDHLEEFMCYRLVYFTLSDQGDALAAELQEHEALFNTGSRLARGLTPTTLARFQSVCGGDLVRLTMRLCSYLQDCDSLMAMKVTRAIVGISKTIGSGITKLIKMYIHRERIRWLQQTIVAFKGSLPSRFLLGSLGMVPVTNQFPNNDLSTTDKKEEIATSKAALGAKTLDETLVFMDGSFAATEASFGELMKDIKLAVPTTFDLAHDVKASLLDRLDFISSSVAEEDDDRRKPSFSIDSGALSQAVQVYCNFLSNVKAT